MASLISLLSKGLSRVFSNTSLKASVLWTSAFFMVQLSHLPGLAQTHVCWVGDAIQPSCPLLSPSPAFNLSQHQGLFQCQFYTSGGQTTGALASVLPKIFRIDWLDLLAVQGTLKSLLQQYSSKPSILLHKAFFMVQLSHPYMTTGKTIALTRWTFIGKVKSLLLNVLFSLVTAFFPRS